MAAGEELGDEHHAEARPEPLLQHGQVGRPLAAQGHRQRRSIQHLRDILAGRAGGPGQCLDGTRRPQIGEELLLVMGEQLGQHG